MSDDDDWDFAGDDAAKVNDPRGSSVFAQGRRWQRQGRYRC